MAQILPKQQDGPWALHRMATRVSTAVHILRDAGPLELLRSLWYRFGPRWCGPLLAPLTRRKLQDVRMQAADRPALIYVATSDYDYPFKQRQQHLAKALSAYCTVFYVSPRQGFDRFWGLHQAEPGLYVADDVAMLLKTLPDAWVMLLSVDHQLEKRVSQIAGHSGRVVYDFIDALDESVERMPITQGRKQAHAALLADPATWVLASARSLVKDAARYRADRLALVTNGVTLADYRVERSRQGLSDAYLQLLDAGRPILGYFGAVASWLDFELLLALAKSRPNYSIAIIGGDYDGSLAQNAPRFPSNVLFHPRVDYDQLARYAAWFDVCLVPFVLNQVTEATSPLKLFEYMALGRPIVSTNIPESLNYASVMTAATHQEFISLIDNALDLRFAPERHALLMQEAQENSWESKARDISRFLGLAPGLPGN